MKRKRDEVDCTLKCKSRYHYANLETIRALKKATTFEIQKLTRRLKNAEEGSQRLVDELQQAKEADSETLGPYYLRHSICRKHKALATLLDLEDIEAPFKDGTEAAKNVIARLLGSKTVKTCIEDNIQKLEGIAGLLKVVEKEIPFYNFPDEEALPKAKPAKRSTNETELFLPALSSGYVAGESDEDDEGELKSVFPAQKKERKNRRGQRARRKIMEMKHGKYANHLIKERMEAQVEYEARLERRRLREEARTGANAIAIEEGERNRKERRELALRPIHQSWQAAKLKKATEKQAVPQGQKIVFD